MKPYDSRPYILLRSVSTTATLLADKVKQKHNIETPDPIDHHKPTGSRPSSGVNLRCVHNTLTPDSTPP
jgi:hypothetical protein